LTRGINPVFSYSQILSSYRALIHTHFRAKGVTTDEWINLSYKEGSEEKAEQIARNLKSMGLIVEQIIQGTGLSTETIQGL